MEAMRLYVRAVEEDEADWYGLLLKVGSMQKEVLEESSGSASGEEGGTFKIERVHHGRLLESASV